MVAIEGMRFLFFLWGKSGSADGLVSLLFFGVVGALQYATFAQIGRMVPFGFFLAGTVPLMIGQRVRDLNDRLATTRADARSCAEKRGDRFLPRKPKRLRRFDTGYYLTIT